MGLTTKSSFPRFNGPTEAVVPTPTFSGRLTDVAADSINPYTSQGPGAGGAGQTYDQVYGVSGDPFFANVKSLFTFNGSITDLSGQSATGTLQTGASINTTVTDPFGDTTGVLETNSTTTSGVLISGAPSPNGVDFTAECWVYMTAYDDTGFNQFMAQGNTGTSPSTQTWSIDYKNGTQELRFINFVGSTTEVLTVSSYSLALNTWHHIAGTREGTTGRLFVNGTLEGSDTFSTTSNTLTNIWLGRRPAGDRNIIGYIDNFRYTVGTARYTASFSVPTEEFPSS